MSENKTGDALESAIMQRSRRGKATPPREYRTRAASGTRQHHPLVLVAGGPKVGKSYAVAAASADQRVDAVTVLEVGGDVGQIDEYGALPGSSVAIVEHDGTWGDVSAALRQAATRPRPAGSGGYNVLVVDGATSLWKLLTRDAQQGRRDLGPDGWAAVNGAWDDLLTVLRGHDGPVVLTARVDGDALADDALGKVRTQKDLAYEVDVVVQASGHRAFTLRGARSLALADSGVALPIELGDLDLPDLFDLIHGATL